ncbi:ThrRS/AlaRS common domain-containing protein, partial [Cystobasidium minutum MCA 4210]|uniref:ThrRS/AlaRS common domain-containing protein n=1 Tax=Cystobasidium minutum MCA 4210 TaxID=1397322 RepID=UPI0034CF72D6
AAVASRAALSSITGQFAQINLSQAAPTPEDYAKYTFDLPHERYVGLLKCQLDPNARELETLVVHCEKQKEPAVARSNGKEKGKAKASGKASVPTEDLYEIELLDTVLFPEGGGQASDFGTITPLDSKDNAPVTVREVVRKNLNAVHFCTAPIEPGTRVLVKVDWERRQDLCTQHTAQHLLSAVLEHHFKLPTLGWALSGFPNLSYVELPRCPTSEELEHTERICNALIVEGRRVRVELQLSQDDNRPDSLPVDYIGGVVRTVIIDDLDANPCCGTHFASLAPLQGIHVSPFTTPIRGTNTRVYFLAGPRIAQQLQTSLAAVKEVGQELSCSAEAVSGRVKQVNDNLEETLRREKRLRDEIAEVTAFRMLQEARSKRKDDDAPLVAAHVREEDSTNDMDFLTSVQAKLKDLLANDKSQYIFAVAHSGHTTPSPDGCLLIFGSNDATVSKIADKLKKGESQYGQRLRGGGKGRWQGKLTEGRFRKEQD